MSRSEILEYRGLAPGRPKADENRTLDRILQILDACDAETRLLVFQRLREEFPIHPLAADLGVSGEEILDAIAGAGPFTLRMIRGVLAEWAFGNYVVKNLRGWESLPVEGDLLYDHLLDDGAGAIKVQVKLQRRQAGKPLITSKRSRSLAAGMYVVEPQRTRGGKKLDGTKTRPYRFGDFDILAVAMQPVTQRWDSFRYTVANWLLPNLEHENTLLDRQPVPTSPNEDWTDDFETCVRWLRSGVRKTIGGRKP